MTKKSLTLLFLLLLLSISFAYNLFEIKQLTNLPSPVSSLPSIGVAGSYAGISNGKLIVAGGANFPEKLPWEGGKKVYYDDIFVLHLDETGENHTWQKNTYKLPYKIGYGATVYLENELLLIGGHNNEQTFNNVLSLQWDEQTKKVNIKDLPPLPTPLSMFTAQILDNKIYVLGGTSDAKSGDKINHFYVFDLAGRNSTNLSWEAPAAWPGLSRILPVSCIQSNGLCNCLYFFSGRNVGLDGEIQLLEDGFVYNPVLKEWTELRGRFPVMAGTAYPAGANNIVFLSGDDGKLMLKGIELESNGKQEQLLNHLNRHPGFSRDILLFNTVTQSLYRAGELPFPGQVTTTIVPYQNGYILPSGEIKPGVRTPAINYITVKESSKSFGVLNSLVLFLYIAVLVWMGWYFSKRQKNTNDYFKGGGRVPWWAAGLSLFGTALSAITFMAIPAKTYATNWSYFMYNMGILFVAPLIVLLFIPYYRRLDITTAYEFLEIRFNLLTRLIGSLSFMLFQIGRMGIVLFLPSIALNVVTGINIFFCILLMGVFAMIYTSIGGIEAVIWTDVLQVIVLLGGALLALVLLLIKIPDGLFGIVNTGSEFQKFEILNFTFDLKQPFFWTVVLGSFGANILTYGTDQTMVQRYLTVNSQKAAEKTVWTNAILATVATVLFFFIGTALYVFYQNFPEKASISINNADAIFPWYIFTQLPAGISGLVIAGIFAAAMSSLSSSINSAATAYINDFHSRFGWGKNVDALKAARWASAVFGLAGILCAVFMATWDIKSLWDEFSKVLGLILGGLGGVFLLGIVSKRANGIGATIGLVVAAVVQYWVAIAQPVHFLMYTATGVVSCFIVGYFSSIFFPNKKK